MAMLHFHSFPLEKTYSQIVTRSDKNLKCSLYLGVYMASHNVGGKGAATKLKNWTWARSRGMGAWGSQGGIVVSTNMSPEVLGNWKDHVTINLPGKNYRCHFFVKGGTGGERGVMQFLSTSSLICSFDIQVEMLIRSEVVELKCRSGNTSL